MTGWRLSDELWTRWMAEARAAWLAGVAGTAASLWREADALASRFDRDDPRRAASLHARALLVRDAGPAEAALRAAVEAWTRAETWVDAMAVVDGARSSLFHQRLEARHGGVYPEIVRRRHRKTLAAGRAAAEAQLAARRDDAAAMAAAMARRRDAFGHRESGAAAMARWLGEDIAGRAVDRFAEVPARRPDDEARLYAAALLVPVVACARPARHARRP